MRGAGPNITPPTGVNAPTIFSGLAELDRNARGLPFGPNGATRTLARCTLPVQPGDAARGY